MHILCVRSRTQPMPTGRSGRCFGRVRCAVHGGTALLRVAAHASAWGRPPARDPVDRMRAGSPPSERVDDFDAVAFAEQVLGVTAAGHDSAVDLDRDTAAGETLLFEQGMHGG